MADPSPPPTVSTKGDPASVATPSRRSAPRWHRWVLVVGLPFGLVLMLIRPQAMTPDEAKHLVRVDQIAHGRLVAPLGPDHVAKSTSGPCVGRLAETLFAQTYGLRSPRTIGLRHFRCGPSAPILVGNTTINSPVTYTPAVAGYMSGRLFGDALTGLWAARVADLLAFLGMASVAIRLTPIGKPLLFLVAVLPSSITLAVALTSDAFPIGLAMLATALVLRLRMADGPAPGSRTDHLLLGALTLDLALLALCKNLYLGFPVLVLLVPRERFRSGRTRAAYVGATLAAALAPALLWWLRVVSRTNVVTSYTSSDETRRWLAANPGRGLSIMLRSVFSTTVPFHTIPGTTAFFYSRPRSEVAPWFIAVPALAALAGAWRLEPQRRARARPPATAPTRWQRLDALIPPLAVACVVASTLGAVVVGEFLTFTPVVGPLPRVTYIEGRFFLPLLPLVLLVTPGTTASAPGPRTASWWVAIPAAAVLLAAWQLLHVNSLAT